MRSAPLLGLLVLQSLTSAQLIEVGGSENNFMMGDNVAALGDVNGDGIPDFIASEETAATGWIRVYAGGTGALLYTRGGGTGIGLFGFNSSFGVDLAAIGDVDGDNRGDFAVAAPRFGTDNKGRMAVYSGATNTQLWETLGTFNNGANWGLGAAVASIGDITGDGKSEVATSEYALISFGARRIEVRSGPNGALVWLWSSATGPQPEVLNPAGDVNDDGIPDLLFSDPNWDSGGFTDNGHVMVLSGTDGTVIWTYTGTANNELPKGTGKLGNVDGIPGDEVLVLTDGEIRILRGADGTVYCTIPLPAQLASEPGAPFAFRAADTGDVDGDSKVDIAVVVVATVGTFNNRLLVFSGPFGPTCPASFPFQTKSLPGRGNVRKAVAVTPSMNGGGLNDIIVGSPECSVGGLTDNGCVSVFGVEGQEILCTPGSVGLGVSGDPGNAFWLITKIYVTGSEPVQGSGWFFGIDMTIQEIAGQTAIFPATTLFTGILPATGPLAGTQVQTIPIPCPTGITLDTRLLQFHPTTFAFIKQGPLMRNSIL